MDPQNTILRTSSDFVLRRIAGEAMLIPVGETAMGNSMISLNDTFAWLWELFSQGMTFRQAVVQAQAEFEDPAGQMEAQIAAFVNDCVRYGMLTVECNKED